MADKKKRVPGKVASIAGYMKWAMSVGDNHLFRGQADMDWKLRSGATRRVYPDNDDNIIYSKVSFYIEDILDRSKLKGFHNKDHSPMFDLELLADLQHHGAATALLDLTKNALIALWFACQEEENDGKVFAMNIQDASRVKRVTSGNIKEKFKFFLDSEEAFIWEPSHLNSRIPAQSSVFLIAKEPYTLEQKEVLVDKKSKKNIRQQLESTFGITEESVFPDFPGFALANAADKIAKFKDEKHYFKLGLEMLRENKYEEAIAYYTKAIELDPEYAGAYNDRGLAKISSGHPLKAIPDLDKAIELDPKFFLPYYNRGNAKSNLENYIGAISDYDAAICLNHEYSYSFVYRGDAYTKLKKFDKARIDLIQATELATKHNNKYVLDLVETYMRNLEEAEKADQ